MLGDIQIRSALLARLGRMSHRPSALIEELRVHNGSAIADVVAIYKEAHCYEIKGDADKIERAISQAAYYDLAFRKITLVTTERHANKAIRVIPAHWGVMIAREVSGVVVLRGTRSSKNSPFFDKKTALMTLWRTELSDVAEGLNIQVAAKANRDNISNSIAGIMGREELSLAISAKLAQRKLGFL
ncbi:sce7726 family protein [Pseudomonas canadensis]|uniref:sce7726 family protein n=1 Tax=Pseudomonas canadensis TaxID=915099 RepID=UPI002810BB6B|nr:sce7726 family protein [Pseudomonas canadensis]